MTPDSISPFPFNTHPISLIMPKKFPVNFNTLLGLLLLVLSLWAIAHELRGYNYHDVFNALAAIPKRHLSWAIWLTAVGYLVMASYDILAFSYIGRSLSWNKIGLAGFISSVDLIVDYQPLLEL